MIEHIVSFKLKDVKDFDFIGSEFAQLAKIIPGIQSYEYQQNIYLKRETNFDAILKVYFANELDLEKYLFHEEHVAFATKMKTTYWENVITIDIAK